MLAIETPTANLPASTTLILDIMGLKCGGCVRNAEGKILAYPGIQSASVNLITELATVECDAQLDPQGLVQMLGKAGFTAEVRASGDTPQESISNLEAQRAAQRKQQRRELIIAIALLALSSTSHLAHSFGIMVSYLSSDLFHGLLAAATLVGPGRSILIEGWQGLRRGSPNMNSLLGLGSTIAFLTSAIALVLPALGWECFFDEPVMLIGFILLGRTLEQQARHRAASALTSLASMQPNSARVVGKDSAKRVADLQQLTSSLVPVDRLCLGDWVQILPSEQIPIDGELIDGETTLDESLLTGESLPVLKRPGQMVYAGTMNQSGAIVLRVKRLRHQTALAQIINLVETAQGRKAPIQQLADRLAGQFTYIMLAIAAATFFFWSLWGAAHFAGAMHHEVMGHQMHGMPDAMPVYSPMLLSLKLAIAVMVVACPCALGLATPTALLVGSGIGAERGLLIRGGDVLERAYRVDTVVFDKTGTLTTGEPQVEQLQAFDPWRETQVLQMAASVEQGTQHPLAKAILQAAVDRKVDLLPANDFQTLAGYGVSARVEHQQQHQLVRLGSADWLRSLGFDLPDEDDDGEQGVVYMAVADKLVGRIAVSDRLRPDAKETIHALQHAGLRVLLLSGDRPAVAQGVAQKVGIPASQVIAGVKPEGKAAAIAAIQSEGHRVAMVGDGINDAPALAQADVGIALQSGTDVAAQTADILLMRNALLDVPQALRLSRLTFRKIQQNLGWALVYNLISVPVAAGLLVPSYQILLSPGQAGFLMALSSITVVLNALLLRWEFGQ